MRENDRECFLAQALFGSHSVSSKASLGFCGCLRGHCLQALFYVFRRSQGARAAARDFSISEFMPPNRSKRADTPKRHRQIFWSGPIAVGRAPLVRERILRDDLFMDEGDAVDNKKS